MKSYLILILLFLSSVALAESPPKKAINFTEILTDDGEPVPDPFGCKAQPCEVKLTLGRAAFYALRQPEQGLTWDEGLRRAELAERIKNAPSYEILPQDIELIKKQIAKLFGPSVVLAVQRAVEQIKP